MVGNSPALFAAFDRAMRFSSVSDLPVLITGESGTGKELLARAIHRLDPKRNEGPFVPVNCAAINPGLAESDFFGQRRGSFTGAGRNRKGLIRSAEGGVLFLDEIGELEPRLQAQLLRVLQESCVLSVGEELESPVNVRFLAATNCDLERMVAEGEFRVDLFHRLCVLLVQIPPLRERPCDLPPLVHHFVRKHDPSKTGAPRKISLDFVAALRLLNLPGNARELENIVCEALLNHPGDGELDLRDLPVAVLRQLAEPSGATGAPSSDGATRVNDLSDFIAEQMSELARQVLAKSGWKLSRAMEVWERQFLSVALRHAQSNQTQKARLLGITARSISRKIHKYRLKASLMDRVACQS